METVAAEIDIAGRDQATNLPALRPVLLKGAEAVAACVKVCLGQCVAPAQNPLWISNWIRQSGEETFVATLLDGENPVFALPLAVQRHGPVTYAGFMGGRHANANFPLIASSQAKHCARNINDLLAFIAKDRPGLDLLVLERQIEVHTQITNPFLAISRHKSPNPALAVSLEGGFDAVLDRSGDRRKRKKHRSRGRKFEAMGGLTLVQADSPETVERLLGAFLEMKAARFEMLGIANTFEAEAVRSFYRHLFVEALQADEPAYVLNGLEVGGVLRAVTGSSICAGRVVCEFSAFADDEAARASPGDFLFYESIKRACETGVEFYDFGVGDEAYKRLWCNVVTTHYDSYLPLTAKGRAAALVFQASATAKHTLKSNEKLWQTTKKLRRALIGR